MLAIESKKKRKRNRLREGSSSLSSSRLKRSWKSNKKTSPSAVKDKKRKRNRKTKVGERSPSSSTRIFLSACFQSCHNWYLINIDPDSSKPSPHGKKKMKLLSPPLSTLISTPGQDTDPDSFASSVVLGSKIYSFGALLDSHLSDYLHRAMVYDTKSPDMGWVRLANMSAPRNLPKLITCRGDIFVLGSETKHPLCLEPWGEVYHPHNNTWSDMPSPMPSRANLFSCVLLPNQKGILAFLFHYDQRWFYFNFEDWQWEILYISKRSLPCELSYEISHDYPDMLTVGNFVYMIYGSKLCVYDPGNHRDGLQLVFGLLPKLPRTRQPVSKLHVGDGNICFVWIPGNSADPKDTFHLMKFRIERDLDFQEKCSHHINYLGWEGFKVDDGLGPIFGFDAFLPGELKR